MGVRDLNAVEGVWERAGAIGSSANQIGLHNVVSGFASSDGTGNRDSNSIVSRDNVTVTHTANPDAAGAKHNNATVIGGWGGRTVRQTQYAERVGTD